MTFKERLNSETSWSKKAMIIELFHYSMVLKKGSIWKMKHSAIALDISVGRLSEDLKIARMIKAVPGLENCRDRKQVLEVIKRMKDFFIV